MLRRQDHARAELIKQEIILHALYENGQAAPVDLETHIMDEIEREEAKVNDINRKMKTAYQELVRQNITFALGNHRRVE